MANGKLLRQFIRSVQKEIWMRLAGANSIG